MLRTPVFAFRAAGQAHGSTFVLRTPVCAFRAAGQAHAAPSTTLTPPSTANHCPVMCLPASLA